MNYYILWKGFFITSTVLVLVLGPMLSAMACGGGLFGGNSKRTTSTSVSGLYCHDYWGHPIPYNQKLCKDQVPFRMNRSTTYTRHYSPFYHNNRYLFRDMPI